MAQALQDRIERDARFASDVSHELRSPLMTLAASIEVMDNQRDELPERSRAALDLMVADIDRFQQLVEDLLEISRFDAGVVAPRARGGAPRRAGDAGREPLHRRRRARSSSTPSWPAWWCRPTSAGSCG